MNKKIMPNTAKQPREEWPDKPGPFPATVPTDDPVETFCHYKPLLFSIAYRMLGSVADAEDILQETFIRWQRSADQEIRSRRAFLVTVVSRLCLQHLESARVRREEYVGQWLPEPVLTRDVDDSEMTSAMNESLSMALLLLLEKLTPPERAVFLLHEVFEYEYREISEILGKTEANCRQLLKRARRHVTCGRPRFVASPERHTQLVEEFLAASLRGEAAGLLSLLSHDVTLYSDGGGRASAALNPIHGADRVVRFLLGAIKKTVPKNVITRIERVNGRPGIVFFTPRQKAGCVVTFEIEGSVIRNLFVVTNPEKLSRLADIPRVV